jgi:hypothetical protein
VTSKATSPSVAIVSPRLNPGRPQDRYLRLVHVPAQRGGEEFAAALMAALADLGLQLCNPPAWPRSTQRSPCCCARAGSLFEPFLSAPHVDRLGADPEITRHLRDRPAGRHRAPHQAETAPDATY